MLKFCTPESMSLEVKDYAIALWIGSFGSYRCHLGEFGVWSATATVGTGLPGTFGVDYAFINKVLLSLNISRLVTESLSLSPLQSTVDIFVEEQKVGIMHSFFFFLIVLTFIFVSLIQ
jgi:hypothetical protein